MSGGLHSQTGHKFIESDRVIDRPVFDHDGELIGKISRLMIDRRSGQVAQVVVHTHGRFGFGAHDVYIPWSTLCYDTRLPGYRTSLRKHEITVEKSTLLTGETHNS